MIDILKKLLTVKSIVTFALTILVIILACYGVIDGKEIIIIYSTVIAFYFGTQSAKGEK